MKRKIQWFLMNGAMAVLMWLGFGPQKIEGAANVYAFMLIFFAIGTTLIAFSNDSRATSRAKGRPVPSWLCATFDFVCAGFLAWNGAFWLAATCLWIASCLTVIYEIEPAREAA